MAAVADVVQKHSDFFTQGAKFKHTDGFPSLGKIRVWVSNPWKS
jgi:hypothetical protein